MFALRVSALFEVSQEAPLVILAGTAACPLCIHLAYHLLFLFVSENIIHSLGPGLSLNHFVALVPRVRAPTQWELNK